MSSSVITLSSLAMNIGNVFSAVFLSKSMCVSLPEQPRPHLKNPFDAIALLSHACMLAVGFRLIGLGEDHKLGAYLLSTPIQVLLEWERRSEGAKISLTIQKFRQMMLLTINPYRLYRTNGMPPALRTMHFVMHIRNHLCSI